MALGIRLPYMVHDVVILGATVAGLTAAKTLASAGFDVVVLDPNQELRSAAIGHGVASVGHASTLVRMTAAYGEQVAVEHVARNLRGAHFIRAVLAAADERQLELSFVDKTVVGLASYEIREIVDIFRRAGAEVDLRGGIITSKALVVDPDDYAQHLRTQAVDAGAQVAHGVTVTHLDRGDGVLTAAFLNNLAWAREPGQVSAVACLDTLGITPWGSQVRAGRVQWAPTAHARLKDAIGWVELRSEARSWLTRPYLDHHLIVGHKVTADGINQARAELEDELRAAGAEVLSSGKLAIDPADEGRPIVGPAGIPGGYYARGNGRGELMNGTASGMWLAQTLIGQQRGRPLPLNRRVRAGIRNWWFNRER